MATRKVKVSELPFAKSTTGLTVLGVDGENQSVQADMELLRGNKGDSAFQLWLEQPGNAGKTYQDYLAFNRQPATDAANEMLQYKSKVEGDFALLKTSTETARRETVAATEAAKTATGNANAAVTRATEAATQATTAANQADVAKGKAETAAVRANLLADNPPQIQDGYWYVYKEAQKKYINTQIPATGAKGDKGDKGNQGDKGEPGAGVNLLGSYPTLAELKAEHPTGSAGDAYVVQDDLYVWDDRTNEWLNTGKIRGETGISGKSPKVQNETWWVFNDQTQSYQDTGVFLFPKNVDFQQATARQNIETGESLTTLFGKIKKYFDDLGLLAFKNKASWNTDIEDKPVFKTVAGQSLLGNGDIDTAYTAVADGGLEVVNGNQFRIKNEWLAKIDKEPIHKTATLAAGTWTGSGPYTYTLADSAVTGNSFVELWPASASRSHARDADIYEDVTVQSGSIRLTAANSPAEDIHIKYTIVR